MSATAIKHVVPVPGLVEALIAARLEFGPVLKSKENPHFRSKFAGLDDVLEAVGPALGRHGLALVQRSRITESGNLVLVTELRHTSGEVVDSEWPLVPAKANDPQALGSALTYGRRYQALAILGIAPEDDDGNAASARVAQPRQAANDRPMVAMITPSQMKALQASMTDAALTSSDARHDFCSAIVKRPLESSKDLTAEEASRCIEAAVKAAKK